MKKSIYMLIVMAFCSTVSFGQLKYGADLYSRYIWRGSDYGNAPSLQPSITFTTGGLSFGFWGAYSLAESTDPSDGSKSTYSENDFWASYSLSLAASGTLTAYFTDYYLPYAGIRFGFFKPTDGAGAAHTLEGGLGYTGPEKFPVSVTFYSNLSNDSENSSYVQVSYPFTISETTLTLTAGASPKKSAYYGTENGGFVNLGITAAKSIVITDKFSLPINVSYINNPSSDISFLIFGVSFTF